MRWRTHSSANGLSGRINSPPSTIQLSPAPVFWDFTHFLTGSQDVILGVVVFLGVEIPLEIARLFFLGQCNDAPFAIDDNAHFNRCKAVPICLSFLQ